MSNYSDEIAELKRLLSDERARTEQHRSHYQSLKLEHHRLQKEYETLRMESKKITEEKDQVVSSEKAYRFHVERELNEAKVSLNELKSQVPSSHKLELIRLREQEAAEQRMSERVQMAESETEKFRNEFNKLRYAFTFLKSQYEHERLEFSRTTEETKLRFDTELSELRTHCEMIENGKASQEKEKAELIKILQKENLRLSQQVKGLESELHEAHEQWNQIGTQTDTKHRQQLHQISELSAQLRSVELEKSSKNELYNKLRHDIVTSNDTISKLQTKLSKSEAELKRLSSKLSDCERSSKMESSNYQVEATKKQVEYEQLASTLQQKIKVLTLELDHSKKEIAGQSRMLSEKETGFLKRIMAFQQEQRSTVKKIEGEKFELKVKYQEAEQKLLNSKSVLDAEVAKVDRKTQEALEEKRNLEKEVLLLGTQLEGHNKLVLEHNKLRLENESLQNQASKQRESLQALGEAEEHLVVRNRQLNDLLESAQQELKFRNVSKDKETAEFDKRLALKESKWEKQKTELRKKIDKLERSVKGAKHELDLRRNSYKKKSSQYTRLITKLKNRIQLLNAKIEEQQIEKEALQKWVPHDIHNVVKKRLRDLQLRHNEFKNLLHTYHLFGSETAGLSSIVPLDSMASLLLLAQQEQSLNLVKDRLQHLDDNQVTQLDQLAKLKGSSSINERI